MSRRRISALVWILLAACLPARDASAEAIYTYVGQNGTLHFSNLPNDSRYVRMKQPKRRIRAPRVRSYDPVIADAARAHGVPAAMVKAVIATESWFNAAAVSPKGAQGLMQLMPATAHSLGVADPFQAEQNVDGGVRYLRHLMNRYGDWTRALAAYNAGPTAVDRYGGVPPYQETQRYVERVLTYYRRYHGDFAP
jgi:soluble lytic murein transglycosylase